MLSIRQLLIFTMLVDKVTSVVRQSLLRKRKRYLRLQQIAHNISFQSLCVFTGRNMCMSGPELGDFLLSNHQLQMTKPKFFHLTISPNIYLQVFGQHLARFSDITQQCRTRELFPMVDIINHGEIQNPDLMVRTLTLQSFG